MNTNTQLSLSQPTHLSFISRLSSAADTSMTLLRLSTGTQWAFKLFPPYRTSPEGTEAYYDNRVRNERWVKERRQLDGQWRSRSFFLLKWNECDQDPSNISDCTSVLNTAFAIFGKIDSSALQIMFSTIGKPQIQVRSYLMDYISSASWFWGLIWYVFWTQLLCSAEKQPESNPKLSSI